MATKQWLVDVKSDNATNFKAWVQDLSDALTYIGLTKSSDTGQLNISSVSAVPAANTVAGYEIRYLNDSLHSSAPVYVKVEYGSDNPNGRPLFAVTVGTGSDGAGNLSGIFCPRYAYNPGHSPGTWGPFRSYACGVDGAAWIAFAENMFVTTGDIPGFHLGIFRSVDAAGEPTADGVVAYTQRGAQGYMQNPISRSLRSSWVSPTANTGENGFGGNGNFAPKVLGISTSIAHSGEKQVVPHVIPFPELRVNAFVASTLPGDSLGTGTQFSVALVGTDPRNYIVVGGFRPVASERFALVWE